MSGRTIATGGRRIEFAEGLAFRADEVLVRGDEAIDRLLELRPDVDDPRDDGSRGSRGKLEPVENLTADERDQLGQVLGQQREDEGRRISSDGGWLRATGVERAETAVQQLRAEGFHAQLNHVFFTHPFSSNPFSSNPFSSNPFSSNPFSSNPFSSNPFSSNPFSSNPFSSNPFSSNPETSSSARPVEKHSPGRRTPGPGAPVTVAVLDTGLDTKTALLADSSLWTGKVAPDVQGDTDQPDGPIVRPDGTVFSADGYLDPAAGHGTFIAGLIQQYAPGCCVRVLRLVANSGDVDEFAVADRIEQLALGKDPSFPTPPELICLSFGGPADDPKRLQAAVAKARAAGIVVVASAGNEGSSVPQYPAATTGVVSVAALTPNGPAAWSNWGDWIDACAPGQDLVSAFFRSFDGKFPMVNSQDPDRFANWARWSGTSFAAPVVVAALARDMMAESAGGNAGSRAERAVERVITAPHLLRLPMMGTVVNL